MWLIVGWLRYLQARGWMQDRRFRICCKPLCGRNRMKKAWDSDMEHCIPSSDPGRCGPPSATGLLLQKSRRNQLTLASGTTILPFSSSQSSQRMPTLIFQTLLRWWQRANRRDRCKAWKHSSGLVETINGAANREEIKVSSTSYSVRKRWWIKRKEGEKRIASSANYSNRP